MKKIVLLIMFVIGSGMLELKAQRLLWDVDFEAFLDNREYENKFQAAQSIVGVSLMPEIGVGFSEHHALRAGVTAISDLGSTSFVDYVKPTIHYTFDYAPFKFDVGLFSSKCVTDNMPRALMYDSLSYYRPVMGGFYWQFYNKWVSVDLWLDWVGRLTRKTREDFVFGTSALFKPTKMFYAGWNGYVHHSTGNRKLDTDVYRPLTETAGYLLYLGVDVASVTPFEKLYCDVGYLGSFTRVRSQVPVHIGASGVQVRFGLEWQGIGVENVYYTGADLMPLWDTYADELYLGDPFYRNTGYNRTDLYINLVKTSQVTVKFDFSFHVAQKIVSNAQLLKISVNLGDYNIKRREPNSGFIWQRWFRKNQIS